MNQPRHFIRQTRRCVVKIGSALLTNHGLGLDVVAKERIRQFIHQSRKHKGQRLVIDATIDDWQQRPERR